MGGEGGMGGGSGPDTTGFLEDCVQGGAQWGTEQMFGPCKSGISVYGVETEFGPYGVRSEYNVGEEFRTEHTTASDWNSLLLPCPGFISGFGADPVGSADLMNTHDLDFGLFSVFYPGDMPEGETFPLLTWGNGTCAMPEGYGPLLRYIASFGYIVVAPNSVQVGSGTEQSAGIDFMLAANADPESKYFQKIDPEKVGAMGHSQGSGATAAAASADARIKAIILFNGGTSATKPYLAISGDRDLGGTPGGSNNSVQASQQPAAWLWYHQIPAAVDGSTTGESAPGHLTLMMEPERLSEVSVAWWDMRLKGKEEAKAMFLGDACTLCDGSAYPSLWPPATSGSDSTPSLEYGHNALLE
jgi:pimeloyl-ACP methyl ester carboxylesterase